MSRVIKYHIHEETFIHPHRGTLIRRFKSQVIAEYWINERRVKLTIPSLGFGISKDQIKVMFQRTFIDFSIPAHLGFTTRNGSLPWALSYGDRQVLYFNSNIMFIMRDDGTARLMQADSGETYQAEIPARGIKPEPVDLTEADWAEIYYALDSKVAALKHSFYGDNREKGTVKWINHLQAINEKIGPDGEAAARLGTRARPINVKEYTW